MSGILEAMHLDDPASLKRAIALIVGALGVVGVKVGMPQVDDNVLALIAGLVATYLAQSGANSVAAKLAAAKGAGEVAAAKVDTVEKAAEVLK